MKAREWIEARVEELHDEDMVVWDRNQTTIQAIIDYLDKNE